MKNLATCEKLRNAATIDPQDTPSHGKNLKFDGRIWRHDLCSTPRGMQPFAWLRSSIALALVPLLFSATALPLPPCASASTDNDTHCAAQMRAQMASHEGCHESEAPAASLSCCDDAAVQTSTPATTIVAANSFGIVMSVIATVVPMTEGLNQVLETKVLQAHSPPLFTLFSVFLI